VTRRPARGARPLRRSARPSGGAAGSGELTTPDGGRVTVDDGTRLWCRIHGDGPSAVVVPAHGNASELAGLDVPGARTVFYDVRGRGRSDAVDDPADLGLGREVADLEAVRAACGADRVSVVAWSYHAGVAAAYALEHPERVERVVLAAPIPIHSGWHPEPAPEPEPHQLAHLDQLEASGLRTSDPAAFCRAWREVYVPMIMGDPSAFDRLAPVCDLANEHPWVVTRHLVFVFAELGAYDWRPALRDLSVPVLVAHGTRDPLAVAAALEWVDAVGDGRLLELEGAGRFPWVERPERFFTTVNRFLAGLPV
jgi:proline iminopeptidase